MENVIHQFLGRCRLSVNQEDVGAEAFPLHPAWVGRCNHLKHPSVAIILSISFGCNHFVHVRK